MKPENLRRPLALLAALACANPHADSPFHGAYAGLSLGYVAGEDTGYETPTNPAEGSYTQRTEPSGGLLAVSAGYALPFGPRSILGLEAEAELRNPSEHSVQKLNGVPTSVAGNGYEDPTRFSSNIAFNVGPRVGYLLNNGQTMLSATAGVAVARITRSFGCLGDCGFPAGHVTSITQTDWQAGWSAGAGIEHLITTSLSAGIDYRHSGFGEQDVNVGALFNPVAREHQHYSEDSVRFSLRYRF